MADDPRVQIQVTPSMAASARAAAESAGVDLSTWLRALLMEWDEAPVRTEKRSTQLSVRLDYHHRRRLDRIARASGVKRSEVLPLLIDQAVRSTANTPATSATTRRTHTNATPTRPAPVEIPPRTAHRQWAALVLDAATRTEHRFGPRKAFIAGVLEELVARCQPDDPDAFQALVRELLPELNQQNLISLHRADLVRAMDPELLRRSHVRHLNADFHFVGTERPVTKSS